MTGITKVSLKDNVAFAVLDNKGEAPHIHRAELGVFHSDTRHLSNWEMTLNGHSPVHLSHELRGQGNSCVFSMVNRDIPTLDGKSRIPRDTLMIRRVLTLYKDTLFEQIEFTNYDVVSHDLEIQLAADCRFDDMFEVRGMVRHQRGELAAPELNSELGAIVYRYKGLDGIPRRTFIQRVENQHKPHIEIHGGASTINYRFTVPGKSRQDIKTIIAFNEPSNGEFFGERYRDLTMSEHLQLVEQSTGNAYLGELAISSDNAIFDRGLKHARMDIEMLSTFEKAMGVVYPYAGIPWFSAPFGRDGLITAYQTLPFYPKLAIGVLEYAFKCIGTRQDAFTDEEPGKIFHEHRRGEMANMKEIPYIPYYGSVDSTPLALILLGEYYAWTHDKQRLKDWWPAARQALGWIEKWGDADGDLFLEYIKKQPTGLDNQGWKDSHNSIMHENGELAQPPIALSEVQAYAYRARRVMSELARIVGDQALAQKLTQQADRLKAKFQAAFWDERDKYVYLALDGLKRPCKVMSSNQGHCLWGRLLDDDQARSVSDHLMSARLFSGYGIRTLASDEKSFNPLSYHNGSIWPHDNSLIAEGLRFYKQTAHLQALADGLFDVLATSEDYRFPELFCGFRRRQNEPPIPYEVACRPQAWAAGSVFLFLKSLLGFMMNINQECIVFQLPLLPHKVNNLEIKGLRVRDTEFSALVQRGTKSCHIEVTKRSGPMEIMVVK